MSKYRFSPQQRFALWRGYDGKCFYCEQPVSYLDVIIDHILPEDLLNRPDELQRIKSECGLDAEFSINNYCNWVPTHGKCNLRKGSKRFSTKSAIYFLSLVKPKIEKIKAEEKKLVKNQKEDTVAGKLESDLWQGVITPDRVIKLLRKHKSNCDPIVITFGLNIFDIFERGLVSADAPQNNPALYDWLENNLVDQLKDVVFPSCSIFYPEASSRDGETLSVRLAFLNFDIDQLDGFTNRMWEILEVEYYSELYDYLANDSF